MSDARLRAGQLEEPIVLDGLLDEPAWDRAPSIDNLVMIVPQEGGEPTGRTIVRVLAGPREIVFGVVCEDPEPSGIVSFTKERDGRLGSEDHIKIVLDPFRDGRTGYVFVGEPRRGSLRRAHREPRGERELELGRDLGRGDSERRAGLGRWSSSSRSRR